MEFYQDAPSLSNQYDDDYLLRTYLQHTLPLEMLQEIEPDLKRLGQRVISDIQALGDEAEHNPPKHIPYDSFGRRIDKIETCAAWKSLDRISAEEKLVAIGYERKYGPYSRVYQFAKLYLFHPSSAVYTCPLAMTDGAARVLELHGSREQKQRAFSRLTTSDPERFWTSGQWMTERTGGSDVSETSTIAKPEGDAYRLYGAKWFSSATTAQMALTLARIEGAPEGSKGLSLFYLETHSADGCLNNIQVNRLKDKLGTRALATAELTLQGTCAQLIGEPGNGVKKISSLLNITRIYNSVCAVGFMRRAVALAKNYAQKRLAFGRPLIEHPLHAQTLADLEQKLELGFKLVFKTVELLGKDEVGEATDSEKLLLRLLTPLVKLFTAKQAVAVTSEALECFGGAGYIEDTGLPRLLRDAQVLPIWEGTTNILCLDAWRVIEKEKAADILFEDILTRTQSTQLLIECQELKLKLGSMTNLRQTMLKLTEIYGQSIAH